MLMSTVSRVPAHAFAPHRSVEFDCWLSLAGDDLGARQAAEAAMDERDAEQAEIEAYEDARAAEEVSACLGT